jgi:8-oxo-dGTP diphosphatase
MEVSRPKVGVGVLVCRGSRVLVGRRRSSSGHGTFALPGGHLEFGESWEGCAAREVKEETGLSIQNIKFASVVNSIMQNENQSSHYVTIFMHAELCNPIDEPQNLEPDKCDGWEWVDWPNIPRPIFQPLQSLIESLKLLRRKLMRPVSARATETRRSSLLQGRDLIDTV